MAVSVAALEKDAVRSYLSWFFERATAIVLDAGSIPLRPEQYAAAAAQVDP